MQPVPKYPGETDPLYDGWVRTLEEEVYWRVVRLYEWRAVWWTLQGVIRDNPTLPVSGMLREYLGQTYASSMAVWVRAELDKAEQSNSLRRILDQMEVNHQHLSRVRWVGMSGLPTERASSLFDQFAGEGSDFVPPDRIRVFIDDLDRAGQGIKALVDKQIAHYDRQPSLINVDFAELHLAVDEIGRIFSAFQVFFVGKSRPLLEEPPPEWLDALRVPSITPGQEPPAFGQGPDVKAS